MLLLRPASRKQLLCQLRSFTSSALRSAYHAASSYSSTVRRLSSSRQSDTMVSDYSKVETPARCYVDFCLVPVSIAILHTFVSLRFLIKPVGYPSFGQSPLSHF
jgi:hypothetical protein